MGMLEQERLERRSETMDTYPYRVLAHDGSYLGSYQQREYAVAAIETYWRPLKRRGAVMKPVTIENTSTGDIERYFDRLES
jgi:hypothetical protein